MYDRRNIIARTVTFGCGYDGEARMKSLKGLGGMRMHAARGGTARALRLVCVGASAVLAACSNGDLAAAQPPAGGGSAPPGQTPDIVWSGSAKAFVERESQTPASAGQDSVWHVYPPVLHTPVEAILRRVLRASRSSWTVPFLCDRESVASVRADSAVPPLLLADDPGRCVVNEDSSSGPDIPPRLP